MSDFTFTFHFHSLEKEMATHSSVLAWRIPGTGEPGGLLSMGSHRIGHDWSDSAAVAAAAAACFPTQNLPLNFLISIKDVIIPLSSQPFIANLLPLFFFNWNIVDLQRCVSFRYTAKWFTYFIFLFRFFPLIGYYRALSRVPCAIQWILINYLFYI